MKFLCKYRVMENSHVLQFTIRKVLKSLYSYLKSTTFYLSFLLVGHLVQDNYLKIYVFTSFIKIIKFFIIITCVKALKPGKVNNLPVTLIVYIQLIRQRLCIFDLLNESLKVVPIFVNSANLEIYRSLYNDPD
jgi:hypothetical protein